MAEFDAVFSYSIRAVKLSYIPLSAFFRANLDRKRQIWLAAWYGLHYVRNSRRIYECMVRPNFWSCSGKRWCYPSFAC